MSTPSYISTQLLAAGSTVNIDLTTIVDEYYFWSSGTITLVGSQTISTASTPVEGDTVVIKYAGRMTLSGNTFTVFGQSIDQELCMRNLFIICRYDATAVAWKVFVNEDTSGVPFGVYGVDTTTLIAAGSTNNLVYGINKNIQRYITTGTITLAAGITIQGTGTPQAGSGFLIDFSAKCTYAGGNTVTVGGIVLTALQALSGLVSAYTYYDGSAWRTMVWNRHGNDDFKIMADATDTAPNYLDDKVQMSIIEDSSSHAIQLDGDSLAPGNSQYYGTDGTGAKGFYPIGSNVLMYADIQIAHSDILTLNSVGYQLVANPGAGLAIKVVDCAISICGTGGVVVPYATNTNLWITTDTADEIQVTDTKTLLSTVDKTIAGILVNTVAATTDTQIIPNKSLYAIVETGDPTGGDAANILTIHLVYRIINIISI